VPVWGRWDGPGRRQRDLHSEALLPALAPQASLLNQVVAKRPCPKQARVSGRVFRSLSGGSAGELSDMTAKTQRLLSFLFRCAICAAAIIWLAYRIDWANLKHALASADWRLVLVSLAVYGPTPVVLALRLRWLLAVHGVAISVWQAVKVTFAGNFIIGALPVGTPGGDAAKAYYVARDTPLKHEAVTTVFVDRVIGVISLVGLAGVVCLLNWKNPSLSKYGRPISLAVILMVVGGGVYFSSRLRALLRVDRILSCLPLGNHIRRIDHAALEFRNHPGRVLGALFLTLVLQVIAIVSHFLAGGPWAWWGWDRIPGPRFRSIWRLCRSASWPEHCPSGRWN